MYARVNCEMTGFPIGALVAYRGDSVRSAVAGNAGWLAAIPDARTAPAA